MKHTALALLLAAAAALLPLPASATQDAVDAKKVFETRCARCHAIDKVAASVAKRPADGREAFLEKFLAGHSPPDEATRKALAGWLNERAGER